MAKEAKLTKVSAPIGRTEEDEPADVLEPSPRFMGNMVVSVALGRRFSANLDNLNVKAHRSYEEMRRQLEGDEPSAIERLLVDRIVACHAVLHVAEMSLNEVDGWKHDSLQKQVDRMHKRYLSAVKALAQIRKLNLPAIQVNIAERQVNIV